MTPEERAQKLNDHWHALGKGVTAAQQAELVTAFTVAIREAVERWEREVRGADAYLDKLEIPINAPDGRRYSLAGRIAVATGNADWLKKTSNTE